MTEEQKKNQEELVKELMERIRKNCNVEPSHLFGTEEKGGGIDLDNLEEGEKKQVLDT